MLRFTQANKFHLIKKLQLIKLTQRGPTVSGLSRLSSKLVCSLLQ